MLAPSTATSDPNAPKADVDPPSEMTPYAALRTLAQNRGIVLLQTDLRLSMPLREKVGGFCYYKPPLAPVIGVNANLDEEKRTHALAHELGYYMRQRLTLDGPRYWTDSVYAEGLEAEAERFAGKLLARIRRALSGGCNDGQARQSSCFGGGQLP